MSADRGMTLAQELLDRGTFVDSNPKIVTPADIFPDMSPCQECLDHYEGCCPKHTSKVKFRMRCPKCNKKGKYVALMGNGRIWRISRVKGPCCYPRR